MQDVLEDSDTRASLMQGGLAAGWSNGFFLSDPAGRFMLRLEGLMQIRWLLSYHDEPDLARAGFENTRTTLTFSGFIFRPDLDLEYLIRGKFQCTAAASSPPPAMSAAEPSPSRTPGFDIPSTTNGASAADSSNCPSTAKSSSVPAIGSAVERSTVNETLNIGRSQGVEVMYSGRDYRWNFAFSDGGQDNLLTVSTLVGTNPANTSFSQEDSEATFTTRFEWLAAGNWKQFEDFTSPPGEEFGMLLGGALHYQVDEFGTGQPGVRNENRWFADTIDLSIEWGGADAFASFTHHYVDNAQFGWFHHFGIVIQGGYYVMPKWELFARGEWERVNSGNSFGLQQFWATSIGWNYYLDGHDAKWTTDLTFGLSQIDNSADVDIAGFRQEGHKADPQMVVRTQFQLMF